MPSKSSSAVRKYQVSAICNSLDGSQNRDRVNNAAISGQEIRDRPGLDLAIQKLVQLQRLPEQQT